MVATLALTSGPAAAQPHGRPGQGHGGPGHGGSGHNGSGHGGPGHRDWNRGEHWRGGGDQYRGGNGGAVVGGALLGLGLGAVLGGAVLAPRPYYTPSPVYYPPAPPGYYGGPPPAYYGDRAAPLRPPPAASHRRPRVTPFHPAKLATLIIGLALPLGALPLGAMAQGTAVAPPAVAAKAKHHHHAPATPEQMAARMERHLSDLRTTLRITPAQQSHWDRFAQVTRDNAAELHQRFQLRGTALASMDAADNMADYAQISELHAQELV